MLRLQKLPLYHCAAVAGKVFGSAFDGETAVEGSREER
jgi:hypothetical protein